MSKIPKNLQIDDEATLEDLLEMTHTELAEAVLRSRSGRVPLVDVQLKPGLKQESFDDLDVKWNPKTGRSLKIEGMEIEEVDFSYFKCPTLVDRYFEFESGFRRKRPNLSSSRTREVSNSMRVFSRFVKHHASVDGSLDIRFMLNEDCLKSFDKWCHVYLKNASTITNHFKYFSQFWKWLRGQDCAKEWVTRLEFLDGAFKSHRQKLKEHKAAGEKKVSQDLLLVMGKWLTEEHHKELISIVGENFAKLLEADEQFVLGTSETSIYKLKERLVIMDHVYLLGMIYCGGQRREFVQMMDLGNLHFSSGDDQYYVPEEKTARQNTSYFILPKEYSVPLRVWLTKYLPALRASDKVLSPWITMKGTPQSDSKMSERMSRLIASYFPGHWITPLYFRRNSVTKVTQENLTSKGVVLDPVLAESHAMLINTSPAVMRQHYDRFNRSKVNKVTLEKVNDILGARPGDRLAAFVARQAERFAKQDNAAAKSVKRVFDHEFTAPYTLFYFVEYQDGSTDRVPALHTLDYLCHVQLYLATIGGLSCNSKLTYKKVTSKGFSITKLLEQNKKKKRKQTKVEAMLEVRKDGGQPVEDLGCDLMSDVETSDSDPDSETDPYSLANLTQSGPRVQSTEDSRAVVPSSAQSSLSPMDCYVSVEPFDEGAADGYDSDWMMDCDFDEDWDYSRPPPRKKSKTQ